MPDANDMDLVREFTRDNSEAAFTELVRRHINLVYSVARRCTGNDGDAHDVTQAVFIILARKAAGLREKTLLTGWLYETTRFAAARLRRTNARRHAREQEAYMQSTLNEADNSAVWEKLSPHLEAAMDKLNAADRALLVLRFYENKSGPEAAALLGIREDAAHKRVTRAIEKLRKFFAQRGLTLSGAAIAGAVSANSVQAAPVAFVKTISAIAVAKGAAATSSTLTLVKGALKIMAWSKMKMAIAATAVVLLAAGTTTVTVREYNEHRIYSWQLPHFNSTNYMNTLAIVHSVLEKTAPQVRIVPTIHPQGVMEWPNYVGGVSTSWIDGKIITHTNPIQFLGLGTTVYQMLQIAYRVGDDSHTLVTTPLPQGLYDFIANLPNGSPEALQSEIKRKFGLVGTWRMVETNVLLLKLADPGVHGFKSAGSLMQELNLNINSLGGPMMYELGQAQKEVTALKNNVFYRTKYRFNTTVDVLIKWNGLERVFNLPIIDETGLTNRYDFVTTFDFNIPEVGGFGNPDKEMWKSVLAEQLGLELIPTNMPIEILVIEKVK
jgi:uncharacterized protein (TIGR03435 family)